jgi:hypothetical protein
VTAQPPPSPPLHPHILQPLLPYDPSPPRVDLFHSRATDIRSHAARVYASEMQRMAAASKRASASDVEARQKSAFTTACAFIEQALAERLRTFHPLVAHPSVSGGIPVQSIARQVQQEEETYIKESVEFVEQQSRDAALAAQAEAAARTLMLQQVHRLPPRTSRITPHALAGGGGAGV